MDGNRGTEVATSRQGAEPTAATASWFVPILTYAIGMGLLGVVTKLALRDISWQEMFVWITGFYAIIGLVLVLFFGLRPRLTRADGFAAITGGLASFGLLCLFIALENADAGKVVPMTAAYPVLTAGFAAAILAERITPLRLFGTFLVVGGIVLIGLD